MPPLVAFIPLLVWYDASIRQSASPMPRRTSSRFTMMLLCYSTCLFSDPKAPFHHHFAPSSETKAPSPLFTPAPLRHPRPSDITHMCPHAYVVQGGACLPHIEENRRQHVLSSSLTSECTNAPNPGRFPPSRSFFRPFLLTRVSKPDTERQALDTT